MTTARVPLPQTYYRGVPTEGLSQSVGERIVNAYQDELGSIRKRPGLASFLGLSINAPIQGMYWWDNKQMVVIVCDGRMFTLANPNGAYTEVTAVNGMLPKRGRVSFSHNYKHLAFAGGGRIILWDGAADPVYVQDINAPSEVTHLAYLDGYLIALQANSRVTWGSMLNDFTVWDPLWFMSPESEQSQVAAVHTAENEIAMFGRRAIEFWYNDGINPFSRISLATQSVGCGAPLSVVYIGGLPTEGLATGGYANGMWVFLDHLRRISTIKNRSLVPMSTAFDDEILGLPDISDARGYLIPFGRRQFYVLNFPSANKTYVLDFATKRMAEWGAWNIAKEDYDLFIGDTYLYVRDWGLHLIGDANYGRVYSMKNNVFNDAGAIIRTSIVTGPVSYGTYNRKRGEELRLWLRRGAGDASGNTPLIRVRWRDDNNGWGDWWDVSQGQMGDYNAISRIQPRGIYRARQYEFQHSENTDFILGDIEEDFTVMDNNGVTILPNPASSAPVFGG